jgi:hypothetical protein
LRRSVLREKGNEFSAITNGVRAGVWFFVFTNRRRMVNRKCIGVVVLDLLIFIVQHMAKNGLQVLHYT